MRFIHRKSAPLRRVWPLALAPLVPLTLTVAATLVSTPAVHAQEPAAPTVRDVVITSLNGNIVTLSEGSDAGITPGAIFTLTSGGEARARFQVIGVTETESTAEVISLQEDFLITVGDSVRYTSWETPPVVATPTPTPTPVPAATPGVEIVPLTPTPGVGATPVSSGTQTAIPGTVAGWKDVQITNVNGQTVTLGAGTSNGVRTGVNIPVWQNGSVVAILRVSAADLSSSTAQVTWSDPTAGPLQVGDTVRIENIIPSAPGSNGGQVLINSDLANIPRAPMLYETGASDYSVPRADRTYELLAGLAASGLITSQPAHVFHDEGTFRHRTAEDEIFTRAQVAGFVRESLTNAGNNLSSIKTRDRAALSILAKEYAKDLQAVGVSSETVSQLAENRGFELGISGQARLSFVKTDDDGAGIDIDPYSEQYGSRRSKSGADLRTNIWARSGDKVQLFATIDAASKPREGAESDVKLRRAVLSYDANNLVRGLTVNVGRDEYWWGVGRYGTLILSDTAGPLNSFNTVLQRGSYKFESLYAPLGRGPAGGQRSLYGHRVELKIGPQTRVGLAETLLLQDKAFDPVAALTALSPVPLYVVQKSRKKNTAGENNQVLYSAYGETSVARGARIYGEFLIDDISTTVQNDTRNRLGTLLGLHLFAPEDPSSLGLYAEFANLGGRTYFPQKYVDDLTLDYNYFYRGAPLGYPVTADPNNLTRGGAESLRFEGYWRPTKKLRLTGGFEFTTINSEQDISSNQQIGRFSAAYDLSNRFTIVGRVQNVDTGRYNFIPGNNRKQTFGQIEVVQAF